MISWWFSLTSPLQFFYGVAVVALVIILLQTALALLGFGIEGFLGILNIDLSAGDASGLGLFSFQTIGAFLLGFGCGGVLSLEGGLGLAAATAVATASGVVLMGAMYLLLRALLSLQSSGNLDYSTAIGDEATVYVTIVGDNRDGGGQIQASIQGRWITAAARKRTPGSIPPGRKVRITGLDGPTSFYVEAD